MELYPGDAFINVPARGVPSHLWFILSDPSKAPQRILIVNVTSAHEGRDVDSACILEPGEHPFIRHRSYVFYEGATTTSENNLREAVRKGVCRITDPAPEDLLTKLRQGLMRSSHSQERFKSLLSEQDLIS